MHKKPTHVQPNPIAFRAPAIDPHPRTGDSREDRRTFAVIARTGEVRVRSDAAIARPLHFTSTWVDRTSNPQPQED